MDLLSGKGHTAMKKGLTRKQQKHMEGVITQIAREHGVTEAEVRRDITELIVEGMKTPDPAAQELWKQCPRTGDMPTPEEFIFWTSGLVMDGLEQRSSEPT